MFEAAGNVRWGHYLIVVVLLVAKASLILCCLGNLNTRYYVGKYRNIEMYIHVSGYNSIPMSLGRVWVGSG